MPKGIEKGLAQYLQFANPTPPRSECPKFLPSPLLFPTILSPILQAVFLAQFCSDAPHGRPKLSTSPAKPLRAWTRQRLNRAVSRTKLPAPAGLPDS